MAVVSDQATAAGVTAVPTPVTDPGSDLWMVHRFWYGDESSLIDKVKPALKVSIDSKAMRKVDQGQDLVIVSEISTAASGSGAVLVSAGRFLVKVN